MRWEQHPWVWIADHGIKLGPGQYGGGLCCRIGSQSAGCIVGNADTMAGYAKEVLKIDQMLLFCGVAESIGNANVCPYYVFSPFC
jgi:hypothetical protein